MTEPQGKARVAYFSMEVGIDPAFPTYGGGLGILAGDMLRSAADLETPIVGVTLLHRKGYFRQTLDRAGHQAEGDEVWDPDDRMEPLPQTVTIRIEGRQVLLRSYRHVVKGVTGGTVPIIFLDADLSENDPWDRTLTDHLYQADPRYRLCQEAVLGLGGVAMLEALGIAEGLRYHMNEGHSSLLTLALLERRVGDRGLHSITEDDIQWVRERCIFTTHTPVPAGHDQFDRKMVERILRPELVAALEKADCCLDGVLNMTYLGLRFSRYVNGVSMKHGEVSNSMFPGYPVDAITNGVHAVTWTSPPFRDLFDSRIPGWRRDNFYLRYAMGIPLWEIQSTHAHAKRALLAEVEKRTGKRLNEKALTIGIARRAAPYKRSDLIFSDLDRLRSIARRLGPVQMVYGGKAHPSDEAGKAIIRRIYEAAQMLDKVVPVVYLENYDMGLAQVIIPGCDLWLNTPMRPQEASGTSGMKAALNGVPSLSILDGWWIEGHVESVTGWSITGHTKPLGDLSGESASLYDKLEEVILPLFHGQPPGFAQVMRSCIALNGSFFNTQRMLAQYVSNAYFPGG